MWGTCKGPAMKSTSACIRLSSTAEESGLSRWLSLRVSRSRHRFRVARVHSFSAGAGTPRAGARPRQSADSPVATSKHKQKIRYRMQAVYERLANRNSRERGGLCRKRGRDVRHTRNAAFVRCRAPSFRRQLKGLRELAETGLPRNLLPDDRALNP